MDIFQVYNQCAVEPVRASGAYLWDKHNTRYLDFYGGHGVISIGHGHPAYKDALKQQIDKIGFYSNAVPNPLQSMLAQKLGILSGYPDYQLFLCNSGAEANENALKLASFQTDRNRVIAFKNGFHGRTSAAVAVTDNPRIQALINKEFLVDFVPLNDIDVFHKAINEDVCAVIIEGIQGIGGVNIPAREFLQKLRKVCDEFGAMLILDEVQSGYGRTGEFFAHQYDEIEPDLITVAKGMGNGFPMAGVLIAPEFQPETGMLGSTFGGNQLACAAGLAVLQVIESEDLVQNAREMGEYLQNELTGMDLPITETRGRGLMLGIEFPFKAGEIRRKLLFDHHLFTGSSSQKNTLRLLPPLSIGKVEVNQFLDALCEVTKNYG